MFVVLQCAQTDATAPALHEKQCGLQRNAMETEEAALDVNRQERQTRFGFHCHKQETAPHIVATRASRYNAAPWAIFDLQMLISMRSSFQDTGLQ